MSQPEGRDKASKRQRARWQVADWGRWLVSDEMIILLLGTESYKINRYDAQRIQDYAEKSFSEMTEKELIDTMNDLHIDSLDLGDDDKQVIKNSDATHSLQVNPLALLTELKRLCDEGVITQDEYELRKQILLDKLSKQ